MTADQATFRVQRTFSAPPERVYRAWLDPALLRQWLAPGGLEVTRAEVGERIGGHFRIWQGGPEGDAGGFECEIVELVPNERIVFDWGWVGPDRTGGPMYDSKLTITLRATDDGGTELTLVHERLDALFTAQPYVAENFEAGWASVLDKLAAIAVTHG